MAKNAYFAYVFVIAWLGTDREIKPSDIALVMQDVLKKRKPFFGLIHLSHKPKHWYKSRKKYEVWYNKGNGKNILSPGK